MARLGVPLVEADLIVRDQAWATGRSDGRHFFPLAGMEMFTALTLLTSPYETPTIDPQQ